MSHRLTESELDSGPRRKCQERTWDFARELRSLRDSCARSRTEEMQALRRSSEEVERCVLRRQLDESAVLQDFLAGLHEDIEAQIEGLRAEVARRLDLLEERMTRAETEGTRVTLPDAVRSEVQRMVGEAFLRVERSAEAVARRASDGTADREADCELEETSSWDARLHRFSAKVIAAGEQAARAVANEVAEVVAEAAMVRQQQRLEELEEKHRIELNVAREALTLEATVVKRAALQAEATSEEVELLKPRVAEGFAQLSEELQQAEMALAEQHSELSEACQRSRSEELRRAELQHAALGRLEESLMESLSRTNSEAMCHAHEVHRRCEALELSLTEASQQGQEIRLQCRESAEALSSLGQEIEAMKDDFQQEQKDLKAELVRGHRDLSNELKPQLSELTKAFLRGQELSEEAQKAAARCDAAWRPEVKDLRQECQSSFAYLRSQAAVTQKILEQFELEKTSLAKGLRELQSQSASHEWRVPRLQQRLEYLSMDSKDSKGVWINSPDFELAGLGPFVLRFYPRGVSGGDGRCAVGLFAVNKAGKVALPLRLDLRISDLRKRASAQAAEGEGVLWLAQGFCSLESLKDELQIGVDIPPFAWSALEASARAKEPQTSPMNPFCKTSSVNEPAVAIPVPVRQTVKDATPGSAGSETQGHRSVPNSPHGSSCSASRPGWAAFGGEELPKRPFSAHVPRSCVSQPMPVLLGSVHRRSQPAPGVGGTATPSGCGNRNPFANERCGNPFDK